MAFDKPTRNRVASFVSEARNLIANEFTQQFQSIYGISDKGEVTALEQLGHLDDAGLTIATLLRERIEYLVRTHPGEKHGAKAAVDRLAREQAFTILNRLAALRMAEKRDLIVESVGKGYQSKGFKVFEQVAGSGLGDTYNRYHRYLYCLFDELAVDLGVLFDRSSPQGLLFPREPALLELLKLLNAPDLDALWTEDETIGWIYQYYNDPAERKKMRDESAAPRNSRELAVRNQFFTPRYVVEFLTDNTLGRIWYEMTQGETRLKEQCRYLVRRPTDIFLTAGEAAPDLPPQDGLTQEELLKQPVYIAHRPLKDPREIRMLDPACGSMHFGLYGFDLFEVIYDEAWEIAHGSDEARKSSALFAPFVAFAPAYPDKAAFLGDVPRLIIEHNIHGIDIDPRCAQIAGLSLWLRAHKSWQSQKVSVTRRPRIRKSNIVCAEPMPGDKTMLREFVQNQFSRSEQPAFSQLLETIFDKMQLAGEAGSLLKIEEEIRSAVEESRKLWQRSQTKLELFSTEAINRTLRTGTQQKLAGLEQAVSHVTKDFWDTAEQRIYAALRDYAEQAENGGSFQRRLFVEDAVRGFAFIDICSKGYDVALMNPPFGDASLPSKPYIEETYGDTKGDVYKAFVECFHARLVPASYLGVISSRTGFFLGQSEDWRTRVVLRLFRPVALADLGSGVLDAMVEVAAYVLRSLSVTEARDLTLSLVPALEKVALDRQQRFSLPKWQAARDDLKRHQAVAELENLEAAGFIQQCSGEIVRYIPLWQAVKAVTPPPEPVFPMLVCLPVLAEDDKEAALQFAIHPPDVLSSRGRFDVNPKSFGCVPRSPFAYWAGKSLQRIFTSFARFEGKDRTAKQGLATGSDGRFLRVWWEVPLMRQAIGSGWVPLVKGGAPNVFYSDPYTSVNWFHDGAELKAFASAYRGSRGWGDQWSAMINSTEFYFQPGITWPLRASRFAPSVMPTGCAFSTRGCAALAKPKELEWLIGVFSSRIFDSLFKMLLGRFNHPEFTSGALQAMPIPPASSESRGSLVSCFHRGWSVKRSLDTTLGNSHAFVRAALLQCNGTSLIERAVVWSERVRKGEETAAAIEAEIDDIAFGLYGLDATDQAALTNALTTEPAGDAAAEPGEDDDADSAPSADVPALTADLLDYSLGATFGRWDVSFATGEKSAPPEPEPFDPLPVCPSGMLQNTLGLPARPEDVPAAYPIRIPWDGILVDDPNHPLDIERRVREVIEIVWKDRAEAIEHEACEILGVKSLCDYFRKPGGFFADHLKRYSKSRRQAPIYWPLSTASGSYTLWIYYHRLTENTLHTALADFIDPKVKLLRDEISYLRSNANQGARVEELQDFEEELNEFRAEIERIIKLPWKPNLNDGVLITASPLWKLFRMPRWQKDLKACWEKLLKGDYDWAHLAYIMWPDRVKEVCKTDRSIAIAHGLEHLCKVEAPKPKRVRKKESNANFEDLEA